MNFKTISDLPKLTERGFDIMKVPPTLWGIISDCYKLLKTNIEEESWDGVKNIIKASEDKHGSEMLNFSNLPSLGNLLHRSFIPLHEKWCNQPLERSAVYGIRSYKNGASLVNHADQIATHHVSSIIVVDKNLDCNGQPEDWPLHIQSHDGKWHKVYTEPGDMVLYESATCVHGRPDPFKGTFYRNFYVHYKLRDWTYQQ